MLFHLRSTTATLRGISSYFTIRNNIDWWTGLNSDSPIETFEDKFHGNDDKIAVGLDHLGALDYLL